MLNLAHLTSQYLFDTNFLLDSYFLLLDLARDYSDYPNALQPFLMIQIRFRLI
jgi:hypothetical protein